jgi:hypothetical protein
LNKSIIQLRASVDRLNTSNKAVNNVNMPRQGGGSLVPGIARPTNIPMSPGFEKFAAHYNKFKNAINKVGFSDIEKAVIRFRYGTNIDNLPSNLFVGDRQQRANALRLVRAFGAAPKLSTYKNIRQGILNDFENVGITPTPENFDKVVSQQQRYQ